MVDQDLASCWVSLSADRDLMTLTRPAQCLPYVRSRWGGGMRWAVIRHRLPSRFRCSLAGEEVRCSWQTRQVKIKLEVGFQGSGRNIHLGPVYIEVPAGRSLTAETSSHPPSLKSLFPSLAVQPVALALLPQASLVCSWFPRFLVLGAGLKISRPVLPLVEAHLVSIPTTLVIPR